MYKAVKTLRSTANTQQNLATQQTIAKHLMLLLSFSLPLSLSHMVFVVCLWCCCYVLLCYCCVIVVCSLFVVVVFLLLLFPFVVLHDLLYIRDTYQQNTERSNTYQNTCCCRCRRCCCRDRLISVL